MNNNNFTNNSTSYEIYNSSTSTIDATNNWWGTTDETVIQNRIYDYNDDFNLGVVNYLPYLTEPNPDAPPMQK
ncbi:MAG: hypothetical protein JXR48_04130 [Candidatus Delongbacteria bacterium]|nr:hypothetical protein [Candidatus Delongbacteria bacterium]MBN2834134.1 hypothetical protein [Candidatus Delongbacteria bacterium]